MKILRDDGRGYIGFRDCSNLFKGSTNLASRDRFDVEIETRILIVIC